MISGSERTPLHTKMNKPKNSSPESAGAPVATGKNSKTSIADDIAALEAALHIELEAFDLGLIDSSKLSAGNAARVAAPSPARQEPQIMPTRPPAMPKASPLAAAAPVQASVAPAVTAPPLPTIGGGSLLDSLRQQAEDRQREEQQAKARQTENSGLIHKSLKQAFNYLHDLTKQLNIIKPGIAREYPILDNLSLANLIWQEGFADYRSQSQSANALLESVSFTYQLKGDKPLAVTRDATSIERLRSALFDYGLGFSCDEFKNERRIVEKADFTIRSELKANVRWIADYEKGEISMETRNLDRLGSVRFTLAADRLNQELLDAFGRLILGQPNNFRDLLRR